MRRLLFAAAALAVALCLSGTSHAFTERMSVEESQAIKRSMLPPGGRMQDYELDHCIPLCLDGSNDRANLQLQPWSEARVKDVDEARLCRDVQHGEMTRTSALQFLKQRWGCK